ncbi:IS91 family transposase, partial [Pontiellaceae bacterium B12227]|nr:IS91 family transposase [Pontiellaceae bacterium B12227]
WEDLMSNSIQQLFRTHSAAYLEQYGERMPANHKKVIRAICNCGTGAFGQHSFACDGCGRAHYADSSCGNRHCPTCQAGKSDEWLKKQLAKVLPVNYFMITFTVPEELRRLIRSNQKACYAALFKAASDAVKKLAKDERHIGCQIAGLTGILHTWTRQLEYHPHVHFIVPGGGLSKDGTQWKASGNRFYIPNRPLSVIYRAKFIEQLKKEGLDVPQCVWDPDWVVDVRHVGSGEEALKYISQYVFRVAIAPSRIIRVADGEVTFTYQPSGSKVWKKMSLTIFEFMRRYLQHVLPHGFTKVRHYGFLAPNCRLSLDRIRELICALYELIVKVLPAKKPACSKPWKCKICGGLIRWREFIPCPRGAG